MKSNEGYCVKCKAKRQMAAAQQTVSKNGRKMLRGICPKCGTKMVKFI